MDASVIVKCIFICKCYCKNLFILSDIFTYLLQYLMINIL